MSFVSILKCSFEIFSTGCVVIYRYEACVRYGRRLKIKEYCVGAATDDRSDDQVSFYCSILVTVLYLF